MHQDDIIRRLSAGEGFGGVPPERLDTHISVIFLVGDDAYKLKRNLTTSYLDYGSLEARHRFCEAEIEINRRTAPGIYLDVLPVRLNDDDTLTVGEGPGETVEWLVHMRRFSQESLFDRMAEDGRLTIELVTELADEIARFHGEAETVRDTAAARRIAFVIEENAEELRKRGPGIVDGSLIDSLDEKCRSAFGECEETLSRRGAQGRVRQCHGDLHLRNICLFEGRPTLFDAIEFSDPISQIDVLFDVAFLLMDLAHRGLGAEANAVFNRYLYRTGDIEDLEILPLFLALRAGIRAHTSAMAAETLTDRAGRERSRTNAMEYCQLGLSLLEKIPPVLIAIGGLSGTGKSTVARDIAPRLGPSPGALILSSDMIRKQLRGAEPLSRLPPEAYSQEVDDAVYDAMLARASVAVAAGHSVILDGTFRDPARRRQAAEVGAAAGVRFEAVWLEAGADELCERVTQRTGDPSDATLAVLKQQLATSSGDVTWRRVNSGRPRGDVGRDVARIIGISTD